jgi:NAD(P)-dependent dehydrogenase (short-subunit alcohol dehydrogenase family)
VVDIDLLGTFNAARLAFEHLRKPGASVINISATQAFSPAALQVHVCAAKAGVDMVTRVLAMEWGPLGVRVNSITPGPIDGTEGMKRLAPGEEARKRVTGTVPLRRLGTLEDVSSLALFLCTPAASYVNGAVLVCDGGMAVAGAGMRMLDAISASGSG